MKSEEVTSTFHCTDGRICPKVFSPFGCITPTLAEINCFCCFEHTMELGIVRPTQSKWASPLHMVKKSKPGDWRPCGDYPALNFVTVPDRYPLPLIHDCVSTLHGMRVFFNYRPCACIPPNTGSTQRHPENGNHHPVRLV